jgi:hypothetical protein
MGDGDPRVVSAAFQGRFCTQRESSCQSPLISAALRKFVPFDELLQRLHCLIEELEVPEE